MRKKQKADIPAPPGELARALNRTVKFDAVLARKWRKLE
jgi:hypothetical protein